MGSIDCARSHFRFELTRLLCGCRSVVGMDGQRERSRTPTRERSKTPPDVKRICNEWFKETAECAECKQTKDCYAGTKWWGSLPYCYECWKACLKEAELSDMLAKVQLKG